MAQVRRSAALVMALALGAGLLATAPAEAASCSVVGKRRVVAGRTEVCTRVGKVRRWVARANSSNTATTTTSAPSTTTTSAPSTTTTSAPSTTTTTIRTTTTTNPPTTTTTEAVDVVKPGLPRSTVDRPGSVNYDVKFIYATFVDGPDERRDTSGAIAGIAADVNRYMTTQFPGHRVRYDMFEGQLDVQYVQIP
ncbi:MAG: hypothetical protein EBY95_02380, partial [Actinobacteria bacterium]|nr:hypothetical protein [Actinomycetota bacterium]